MTSRFEVPDGVRFECLRCGDSCRGWNVMVTEAEAEGLRALDWIGKVPSLAGMDPVVRPARGPARLARREDGACTFLGEDNSCLVHAEFGASAKPLMCRLYPFGFLPVGLRIAVDAAWSCRAVSEEHGAPVAGRESEWARMLEAAGAWSNSNECYYLREGVPLEGELLWEFEHRLVDILSLETLPWLDRLRCVAEYVTLTATGDPTLPSAVILRAAIAAGLPKKVVPADPTARMDASQAAVFFQWLYLALNPAPANFDLLPPAQQEQEARRRVGAATRFRDRKGRPWVDGRELPMDFEAVSRVSAGVMSGSAAQMVGPFLRAKIVGQRFLASPGGFLSLVEATARLVLLHPMALWTAKALAAERGVSSVETCDARGALRLLDRTLGQVSLAELPKKQQAAFTFVMSETDLLVAATMELGG